MLLITLCLCLTRISDLSTILVFQRAYKESTVNPIAHLDGADVIVIDSRGCQVPVDEVRVEPGVAVVAVDASSSAWLHDLLSRPCNETLHGAVYSVFDGRLHHRGALRVVLHA